MENFSGLKNKFEIAVVNEPSVFEPLKFYCIQVLFKCFKCPKRKKRKERKTLYCGIENQVHVFYSPLYLIVHLPICLSRQWYKTRIRFILHILYYKVYNSSCSQVGHDLPDRVKSWSEQIRITASICKHIYVTMEVLHVLA